jgi:formylglycine-generating enzyme required for sulfatase activity
LGSCGSKTALASIILLLALCAASCKQENPPAAPAAGALPVITTAGGATMVAIPAGSFEMGSSASREKDETPHRVYVNAFYMDQYEVTQEHFEKLLGRNPSRWKEPKNPVEQIRWKDAAEYSNARSRREGLAPAYDPKTWRCDFAAAGYRLPTEAEWEYACRAGARTEYSFGDGPAALGEHAWFKENCTRSPQPVGGRKPNPWGLYDMYGNVWEWCHDFYGDDYYRSSPEKDPSGPPAGETRVLRGGCWNSRASMCRSAYRNDENPGYTDACFGRDVHGFVGFRCVRSQPGK